MKVAHEISEALQVSKAHVKAGLQALQAPRVTAMTAS